MKIKLAPANGATPRGRRLRDKEVTPGLKPRFLFCGICGTTEQLGEKFAIENGRPMAICRG
jgi:hypothetical protein